MKTLAIETSCDDTSLAIVNNENWTFNVEKIVMYSQIQQHIPFGWVLPEIASRLHSEKIVSLINELWLNEIEKVDFISVTVKPWLPGSLLVWKTTASLLAEFYGKDLVEVDHIHWHIFSIFLERKIEEIRFPLVILTASGGHNDLYVVNKFDNILSWKPSDLEDSKNINRVSNSFEMTENTEKIWPFCVIKIWYTLDDAAGETFDKVSKMLGGPYPWWPWISTQALKWNPNKKFELKRIFLPLKNDQIFEFSFSWMKSQVLQLLARYKKEWKTLTEQDVCDIAYEFQESIVETLWKRLIKAAKMYGANTIAIAGWVSANKRLIEYVETLINERNKSDYAIKNWLNIDFVYPVKNLYSTDNWAMIGVAGILMKSN